VEGSPSKKEGLPSFYGFGRICGLVTIFDTVMISMRDDTLFFGLEQHNVPPGFENTTIGLVSSLLQHLQIFQALLCSPLVCFVIYLF